MIIRAYLVPFFRCRSVMIDYQSAAKKKAKNNLVTATVIMILYEHTHQAGETTDDKYIQVKPLYLILFKEGKAFDWFRGLVFGPKDILFWVKILDLDPDCLRFSFWCRLSFWTGFVYPTF